jgi:hypothetical protein
MKLLLLFLLISPSFSYDGDEENKINEEALVIDEDHGPDSPELETYLQEKELLEEDVVDLKSEDSKD